MRNLICIGESNQPLKWKKKDICRLIFHIFQACVLGRHISWLHRKMRLWRQQPEDCCSWSSCGKPLRPCCISEQAVCYFLEGERYSSHEQVRPYFSLNVSGWLSWLHYYCLFNLEFLDPSLDPSLCTSSTANDSLYMRSWRRRIRVQMPLINILVKALIRAIM